MVIPTIREREEGRMEDIEEDEEKASNNSTMQILELDQVKND